MATVIYGFTSTGLVIKTLSSIRADLDSAMRSLFGLSIPLGDETLLGQINGILAAMFAELWALIQAVYSAQDPDAATGTSLDVISSYTGVYRAAAKYSTVTVTLVGTPLTAVPSGTQIKAVSTGTIFGLDLTATILTLTSWAPTTLYATSDQRTNNGNVYLCTAGGTSGGTGPLLASNPVPTDGGVTWLFLGVGTGAVDTTATATITGSLSALAGDITAIVNPVGGLSAVRNNLDATPGSDVQTDASLRLTRQAELSQAGNSPPDAIRAAVLLVSGVTSCTVYYNVTDITDVNSTPPHSVQVLVQGGLDQDVANVIFANVAAGIGTYGNGSSATVVDSQGTNHTINFSRVTLINVSVDITLTYNPATITSGGYAGDAAIQAAVATFGNLQASLGAGRDVVASSISASAFPLFYNGAQVAGVQGVLDVTSVKISSAVFPLTPPSPTVSTTIVLNAFQQAVYDSSRVFVHSTPGSV